MARSDTAAYAPYAFDDYGHLTKQIEATRLRWYHSGQLTFD